MVLSLTLIQGRRKSTPWDIVQVKEQFLYRNNCSNVRSEKKNTNFFDIEFITYVRYIRMCIYFDVSYRSGGNIGTVRIYPNQTLFQCRQKVNVDVLKAKFVYCYLFVKWKLALYAYNQFWRHSAGPKVTPSLVCVWMKAWKLLRFCRLDFIESSWHLVFKTYRFCLYLIHFHTTLTRVILKLSDLT